MKYSNDNVEARINADGFYVGGKWLAISWSRRGWMGLPAVWRRNRPCIVVGFGWYLRLGKY